MNQEKLNHKTHAQNRLPRYNLVAYNIPRHMVRVIPIVRIASASILSAVGGRVYIPMIRSIHARILGHSELRVLIPFGRTPIANMQQRIEMWVGWRIERNSQNHVFAVIFAAKDMNILRLAKAGMHGRAHLGKNMLTTADAEGRFSADVHIGKVIFVQRSFYWNIGAHVLMGLKLYVVAEVDVTIPPGGEIRINSDAFTAMMGQQNILHLYRGGWIFLNRNTAQLVFETGSGGELAGEILYNERYI